MKSKTISTILMAAAMAGCQLEPESYAPSQNAETTSIEELSVPENFHFRTAEKSMLSIKTYTNTGEGLGNVPVSIYTAHPDSGGQIMLSTFTDESGHARIDFAKSQIPKTFVAYTPYLGLPSETYFSSEEHEIQIGRFEESSGLKVANVAPKRVLISDNFYSIANFNAHGKPNNIITPRDQLDADFLNDVNATLPEQEKLPDAHPHYLDLNNDTDIKLKSNADVWITFVHEGAGYKNVLGYYTYPLSAPPATKNDIDSMFLIFPNASYRGSGGQLISGDKVHLGRFPANTGIGFFLVANGFKSNKNFRFDYPIFYSNPAFNPESDPNNRQHIALINDMGRNLVLMGFEDINRERGDCDQDFNDAVFYITANPYSSIDIAKLPTAESTGKDSDGDGISDNFDAYPSDAEKAFDQYTPSEAGFGTLVYEDLWPGKGDYDFNDLVMDYNFHYISNQNNEVVAINARFVLRASGAGFENAFAFEMPINASAISSVNGQVLTDGFFNLSGNGTESGNGLATIPVFDNAKSLLDARPGIGINTDPNDTGTDYDTLLVNIEFNAPQPLSSVGLPPYNPFIVPDQNRNYEIHLPGMAPTALADASMLGTGHDRSAPGQNRYYQSEQNLPWALNLIEGFAYPIEKIAIIIAYPHFADWARSGGMQQVDWYLPNKGNQNYIYNK